MNEPSGKLNINKFPDELIGSIFSFLSQRYLHRASTVCKKWLKITRQPKFYKSVELRSTSQIEKFIVFIQTVIINGTPLSNCIKEIIFYDRFIHNLKPNILVILINLCLYVTHVKNIPDIGEDNYKALSDANYWWQSKELPLSYTKMDKRWMEYMKITSSSSDNKYKVISLSIDISQYIVLSIEDYSKMVTDDERNYKLLVIEYQRNCELPRRYNDFNRREGSIVSFSSYYLKLPPSLTNLKELYLDFETYNKKNNLCYYGYNETTLDSISISCPSLTHLTFSHFNFNTSNTLLNQLDPSSSSSTTIFNGINPSPQLKYLNLFYCYLHDPNCYTYIQHKYRNLSTLNLMLAYIPEMNTHHTEYKLTIGNLITSYNDSLTDLQIQYVSDDVQNVNEQNYWPHTELLAWLMTHPNQLITFKYPFDLFTIEREENDWETTLAIEKSLTDEERRQLLPQYRNYLHNLKMLKLKFDLIPEITLQYLLYQNPSEPMVQYLYRNVEHLYVFAYFYLKHCYQNQERQFFIYDWLSVFSGLKILEIDNLWLFHDYQLVDPHQNCQQRFSTINETIYRLNPCYQLTVLKLKNCRICFDLSEMTQLLESLINLQSLFIDGAWFTARTVLKSFIVSAPHLDLSNLQLSNLKCDQLHFWTGNRYREFPEYELYYIKYIEVKEISTNNSIKTQNTSKDSSLRKSDIVFNFVCNSVDNFWS